MRERDSLAYNRQNGGQKQRVWTILKRVTITLLVFIILGSADIIFYLIRSIFTSAAPSLDEIETLVTAPQPGQSGQRYERSQQRKLIFQDVPYDVEYKVDVLGDRLDHFTIDWDQLLYSKLIVNASQLAMQDSSASQPLQFTAKDKLLLIDSMENFFNTRTSSNSDHSDNSYNSMTGAYEWLLTLEDSITWNNPNYEGYCHPNLHSKVAFTTMFDDAQQYGVQHNGVRTSGTDKDVTFTIDTSVFDFYNSSIVWDDMTRKDYFQEHQSQWRYENVIVSDVNENPMSPEPSGVEVVLAKNMIDYHTHAYDIDHPEDYRIGVDAFVPGNRFLCVYSDGTTTISEEITERSINFEWIHSVLIVHCPLERNTKEALYKQWVSHKNGGTNAARPDTTNLGLALFSLHPKESQFDLLHQLMISVNVQLPLCHKSIKNRKPRIYKSEKDYFDISQESLSIQHNIYFAPTLDRVFSDITGEPVETSRNHFLSAVTLIHPSSRSGQSMLMMQQWLDYHMFHGFDHFYVYDHLYVRTPEDITSIYDSLKEYVDLGVVTYFNTLAPLQGHWSWQHAVFVMAPKILKYDTHLLAMTDIDEWFVISPQDGVIDKNSYLPTLREIYAREVNNFNYHDVFGYRGYPNFNVMKDKLASPANDNFAKDCDVSDPANRHDTFLERQSCLVYKIQNKNLTETIENLPSPRLQTKAQKLVKFLSYSDSAWWMGFANMPKIVIDPAIMHNGWMHYLLDVNLNLDSKIHEFDSSGYDVFMSHLADHVYQHGASKTWAEFDYNNADDMKLFMQITDTKCDHEDSILYWNKRFLSSEYGAKYRSQRKINPFMDRNAKYCYLHTDEDIKLSVTTADQNPPDIDTNLANDPSDTSNIIKNDANTVSTVSTANTDDTANNPSPAPPGLPSEFSIDWDFLTSELVASKFTAHQSQHLSAWNPHLVQPEEKLKQVEQSVIWNNPHFSRVCMAGAYTPQYAFISLDEMEHIGLKQKTILAESQERAAKDPNSVTVNDMNWGYYSFWFNTTQHHDTNMRTNYLRKHKVQWRVDGVLPTIIEDHYMVEVMLSMHAPDGYAQEQGWSVAFEKDWENPDSPVDIRHDHARFLCVFSDGTTFMTDPSWSIQRTLQGAEQYYEKFINCDVTEYPHLKQRIFDSRAEGAYTDLGLTIFSLRPKLNSHEVFNEMIVAASVQLPVCNKFVINRAPKLYQSEIDYFERRDDYQIHKIFDGKDTSSTGGFDYKLMGWTIVHPESRMNDAGENLRQWIDWHRMMGFEHFVVYDHQNERTPEDIDFHYNVLKPYIQQGVVTLVEWPVTIHHFEARQYQVASMMHALKSYRYYADYVALTDIDEWMMVEQQTPNSRKAQVLRTVKEAIQDLEKAWPGQVFDRLSFQDFRAWGTDLYGLLNGVNGSNSYVARHQKQVDFNYVGCRKFFDTYIERQNCIYGSLDSKESMDKYNGSYSDNVAAEEMETIKSLVDTGCGFEVLPKQIVNPRSCYSVNQHEFRDLNTLMKDEQGMQRERIDLNSDDWNKKYNIFAVHTADHYRPDAKGFPCYQEYLPNFEVSEGAQMFINVVNSNCQSQDTILAWNDKFLKSKEVGYKYLRQKNVKPILADDFAFCFLKPEFAAQYNSKFAWIDEVN